MSGFAKRFQPRRMLSAVLETMKMHLKTTFRKCFQLEKHVDNASVIHRTRYVETYDMYMIIRRISHISSAEPPLRSPNRAPALQI